MFAIIEAGGKQYLVKEGDTLKVEKLPYDEGSEVVFDKVLLLKKENEEVVGTPYVEGAKVLGKVLKQMKERKIKVFTYHAKTTSLPSSYGSFSTFNVSPSLTRYCFPPASIIANTLTSFMSIVQHLIILQ